MKFYSHIDGRVTVDQWDSETLVSAKVIELACPDYVQRRGDELVFTVDNGTARYQIVDERRDSGVLAVRLLESQLQTSEVHHA